MKPTGGRPSIPIPVHKLRGTYNPKIHGEEVMPPEGPPEMPATLTGHAKDLWEKVVPTMVRHGIVGEIDAAQLTIMCEFWAEYRRSMDEVKKVQPGSKSYDTLLRTAGAANINFNSVAKLFGMSPSDRARLGVEMGPKKESGGIGARKRDA